MSKRKEPIARELTGIGRLYHDTLHMLEQIVSSGKLNPVQGLLGTIMIADLLHGGAYTVPNNERPSLVGSASKYYGGDMIGPVDFYPVPGFNIFDIFSSITNFLQAGIETQVGMGIAREVYLNTNVPHKFPKLLSDEAYAKILLLSLYLSHSDLVTKTATGVKVFVEGETRLIEAETKMIGELSTSVKKLLPLLSKMEGVEE